MKNSSVDIGNNFPFEKLQIDKDIFIGFMSKIFSFESGKYFIIL